jgi:transcriptional regulator with XRE-family HTH domain
VYGDFLRLLRTSRGLSQGALAEIVGISQPNLSAYEQGRRVPTLDTLNRLVVACGYELAATDGRTTFYCPLPVAGWFPDDEDPPPSPDDPPEQPPSVTNDTPMADRVRALVAALELAEATR